jgi:hypothetical protein
MKKGTVMKKQTIRECVIAAAIILSASFAQAQMFFPDPVPYPAIPRPAQGFFHVPDEPGKSFHEARQNFLHEEAKIAASDIRKGAAYLKMEKAVVRKEMQDSIAASERELEKLAQNVEQGTVESARELDEAFARAHQALAKSYIARASEAWAEKDAARTGQLLKAALIHLKSAVAWSGQKMDASTAATVRESRHVAGKLIAGTGWAAEEVGKALETTGREIDKSGEAMQQGKK